MTQKRDIKELSKLFPYIYASIITDNEDLITQNHLNNINDIVERILKTIEINKDYYFEYKIELLSTLIEIISSNLMLFDDPNYEWTENFILEFFENNQYKFSKKTDDLKLVVVNSLGLVVKEYTNFHSSLFFSDKIDLEKMKTLNVNILNKSIYIIADILDYINNNLGSDFLNEHVKLSGRIYAYTLSGLFNTLNSNPHRIIDYINKQDKFLKNVESIFLENYSSLVVKSEIITKNFEG